MNIEQELNMKLPCWSRKTLPLLLALMLTGCPDSVKPPKKPPPGPHTPDAPRVPEPKAHQD